MDPLSIASFNIRVARAQDGPHRWYLRRELVFGLLREVGADVMGLQEVLPAQLDEILDAVPGLGAIADRRYAGRMGTYAPILFDASRLEAGPSGDFWLSADPDGARVRGWDAAVPRICAWAVLKDRPSGRRFAIFNTHFDQAGAHARAQSARLVAERMGRLACFPRLVTADLNADEGAEPMDILRAAGLRDTYRVVHPSGEALTFHGFRGRGARSLGKIDYVLCDGGWEVLEAAVVRDGTEGRFASDHFAVTALVRLMP